MVHVATAYALMTRRRRRAFFLAGNTQQMKSQATSMREISHEIARALTAVGAAAAWAMLLLLLAG
jgi:hypothetical protein